MPTSESAESANESAPLVAFKNVSFAYAGSSGNVLSDISFELRSGETLGIIGGTGSGKSTLINLVPRFYDITSGAVEINGVNVRSMSPEKLRQRIGVASQKATLFAGSIRDNIKWGKSDASDEEIIKALDTAQISSILKDKPEGLDAKIEQNGRNLSGGQRQRLNVARALVKRPEILILDDSSSALDRVTDANLRKAIHELDYSPAVFIVSQRAESVAECDKILVLDAGAAVGLGTHVELYESCIVYREICDSQKGGESR